jgi:cell division protein FtsQ
MARKKRRKKSRKSFFSFSFVGVFFARLFQLIWQNIGILVVIALIVAGSIWFKHYCMFDDAFSVKRIQVSKTQALSRDSVVLLSGIEPGDNIFRIDLVNASRLLEELPRIKRAEVRRILPHTIAIEIIERKEIAQVKLPFRSSYYLIDSEGCVLPPILKNAQTGLCIIEARFSGQNSLQPGEFFWNEGIQNALLLENVIRGHAFLASEPFVKIVVDHALNMSVFLYDEIELKVGKDPSGSLSKLENVQEVLSPETRNQIKYIDLRFKDVVVKKK